MDHSDVGHNCYLNGINEFKIMHSDDSNYLSILQINVRSLKGKIGQLKAFLHSLSFNFTFIVLTEVWLSDSIDKAFDLDNYNYVSMNRNEHGGE